MGKYGKLLAGVLAAAVLALLPVSEASAKETIFNSPYVSFSADNKAWTTNAGEKNTIWYEAGTRVDTGIASTLRETERGEHYYRTTSTGEVAIGYWKVEHSPAKCIHSQYPPEGMTYHGLQFGRQICYTGYYSGWTGYCADCGERAAGFVYMKKEAAESIDYLPADMEYYYICPHCRNLEQGAVFSHLCKKISNNRYKVRFSPNTARAAGYMEDEIYLYDNVTSYEGEEVTVRTALPLNQYRRTGYRFAGWNTMPDGSGTFFEDGQEICNLSDEDWQPGSEKGIVTLYACWEPASSKLLIDPGKGTYLGKKNRTVLQGGYGEKTVIQMEELVSPKGYTVKFDTAGGEKQESVTCSCAFEEWSCRQPFHGLLKGNTYYFKGGEGDEDLITAVYRQEAILLPEPVREGYLFGGWYYDKKKTRFAGRAGDSFTPTGNVTLYANWVELALQAEDNYLVLEGTGAVDLSWNTAPVENTLFQVSQSLDGTSWTKLREQTEDGSTEAFWKETKGEELTILIPRTGIYLLEAAGAPGGDNGRNAGGEGGVVQATFWLEKGETITITCGKKGASADQNGKTGGGGATVATSDRRGVLMIAGGGGGATSLSAGKPGGSEQGLRTDQRPEGETGQADGGDGFAGGTAGEVRIHSHENCEVHSHDASCYEKHTHTALCYENYAKNISNDKVDHLPCGCKVQKHHYQCTKCDSTWTTTTYNSLYCKKNHYNNAVRYLDVKECHGSVLICSLEEKNYLACTKPAGYLCGMETGGIELSTPAYGGSNFCSDIATCVIVSQAGGSELGHASLQEVFSGLENTMELSGVAARDLVAPDTPAEETMTQTILANKGRRLFWRTPADNGTLYYHKVEMFLRTDVETPLLISNRTENTLISGVAGYYVLVNRKAETKVNEKNGTFTMQASWDVENGGTATRDLYLHVAAVDRAGNVSDTLHVNLSEFSGDKNPEAGEPTLVTEPLSIAKGENTWEAGKGFWYVRADGRTPFLLTLRGENADETFLTAVTYAALECVGEKTENRLQWEIPKNITVEGSLTVDKNTVVKTQDRKFPLVQDMNLAVETENYGQSLAVKQGMLLETSRQGILYELTPRVGAACGEGIAWSDGTTDRKNGLKLMGDGEAPVLYGLSALESGNREAIRRGEKDIHLWAEDTLSGLEELCLTVRNTDNYCEETFWGDESGELRVTADSSKPLWNGSLVLTVTAKDHVGNVVERTFPLSGIGLEVSLERVLEPKTPVFKPGEAGRLLIHVTGSVTRLEIIFPNTLTKWNSELNRTLTYSGAEEELQEDILFLVPLQAPGGEGLPVTVRAYGSGGAYAEDTVTMSVVEGEGSILGELRTRLR